MAATFVTGSGGSSSSGGATCTFTYSVDVHIGDLLRCHYRAGPGGALPNYTFSDNVNGTGNWKRGVGATASNSAIGEIWYCWASAAATAGNLTITGTQLYFAGFGGEMECDIIRGAQSTSDPLDVSASGTNASGISTTGSVTPTANGTALAAYYDQNGGVSSGTAGFTESGNAGSSDALYQVGITSGTAVSYTGASTSPSSSFALIAVFKDAGPPPAPGTVRRGAYHYSMVGAAWFDKSMAAAASGWFSPDAMAPALPSLLGSYDPPPRVVSTRAALNENYPIDDASIPASVLAYFGGWTGEQFARLVKPPIHALDAFPLDDILATPVLREFLPEGRQDAPRAVKAPSAQDDLDRSLVGGVQSSFLNWAGDAPLLARTRSFPEMGYLGSSIGWAPTNWVRWVEDLLPSKVVSRVADTVPLLEALVVPTLAYFGGWVAEQAWGHPPYTHEALQPPFPYDALPPIPPSEFQTWSVEPLPSRLPTKPSTSEAPLDPTTGAFLSGFLAWSDPTWKPVRVSPAAQDLFPLDDRSVTTLAYFGGWVPEMAWQHPPYTREAVQAPYPLDVALSAVPLLEFLPNQDPFAFKVAARVVDQPYLGSAIGFASVEFQTWSVDPLPFRGATKPAESAAPLDAAIGPASTPFLAWSDPTWRPVRVAAAVADLFPLDDRSVPTLAYFGGWVPESAWKHSPYTREALQAPYPLDAVLPAIPLLEFLPNADPLPAAIVRRVVDQPYLGSSIGWAPTSWVQWTTDPAARARATSPAENPAWTFAALGLSRFLNWAGDLMFVARRATPADAGQAFVGAAFGVLAEYVQWSADPSPATRRSRAPEAEAPLPQLQPPVRNFVSWTSDYVPARRVQRADNPPNPLSALVLPSLARFLPAADLFSPIRLVRHAQGEALGALFVVPPPPMTFPGAGVSSLPLEVVRPSAVPVTVVFGPTSKTLGQGIAPTSLPIHNPRRRR